jgi:putative transposase
VSNNSDLPNRRGRDKKYAPKSSEQIWDTKAHFQTIMDFYQVRFQIEFNFRDARQFFGLSHFKNIKQTQVTNVIGAAFFMTCFANILLFELKQIDPNSNLSIQDLKAFFRAEKYLNELYAWK